MSESVFRNLCHGNCARKDNSSDHSLVKRPPRYIGKNAASLYGESTVFVNLPDDIIATESRSDNFFRWIIRSPIQCAAVVYFFRFPCFIRRGVKSNCSDTLEGIVSNKRRVSTKENSTNVGAAGERPPLNARHTVRYRDACQAGTTRKHRAHDTCHALRNNGVRQRFSIQVNYSRAAWNLPAPEIQPAFKARKIYRRNTIAAGEGIAPNARQAFWNGDARQAGAVVERIAPNAPHALWNGDACQAGAAGERTVLNTRHAFWNGNARQASAVVERPLPNARHAVTDCYAA